MSKWILHSVQDDNRVLKQDFASVRAHWRFKEVIAPFEFRHFPQDKISGD